jgi:hypothetical protein
MYAVHATQETEDVILDGGTQQSMRSAHCTTSILSGPLPQTTSIKDADNTSTN